MDFLSYYKDILSEITKYLSCTDLRKLKLSLPELDLESFFEQRLKETDKYQTKHLSSIKEIIQNIFETGRDRFLLYNRKYDSERFILTCDIDIDEATFLYSTTSTDTDTCPLNYQQCISPILINDSIIVKLNNGCQLFFSIVQYRNLIVGPEELDLLLNQSYLEYLLLTNQLKRFVDHHREQLSELNKYLGLIDDEYVLFVGADLTLLIWNYLPEINRQSIHLQLSEILEKEISSDKYWMNIDDLTALKNWLNHLIELGIDTINKRKFDQLN